MRKNRVFMTAALAAALATVVSGGIYNTGQQEERQHPAQEGHGSHTNEVNKRGDHVMGFDHKQTTHHFLLHPDGGSIEVTVNDAADRESREQIRKHLGHIAKMFAGGNFKAPMLVHAQTPPGVPDMQRLKSEIKYQYGDMERGARVRISTSNPEALSAIHEFLRFQIKDHETGDSTEVKPQG